MKSLEGSLRNLTLTIPMAGLALPRQRLRPALDALQLRVLFCRR